MPYVIQRYDPATGRTIGYRRVEPVSGAPSITPDVSKAEIYQQRASAAGLCGRFERPVILVQILRKTY